MKKSLNYVLENLWQTSSLPQCSLIESSLNTDVEKQILSFINIVTCPYTDIPAENNSDVEIVKPPEQERSQTNISINLDSLAKFKKSIAETPAHSPYKFLVIIRADLMNLNAANSILKILEDCPENTYIILVTKSSENLIKTVKSRAIKIYSELLEYEYNFDLLESSFYQIINPEVRFEDKVKLFDVFTNQKEIPYNILSMKILYWITNLTFSRKSSNLAEYLHLSDYIVKRAIKSNDLHKVLSMLTPILINASSSHLDMRQILFLVMSKIAVL